MRLLDVEAYKNLQQFQIKQFADSEIPKYAILSHRWDDVEPTFQEVQNSQVFVNDARARKLTLALQQAHADGLGFVWVDTCCIDKKSSEELSEAINSMFRWYQNSSKCYAYLRDFGEGHPRLAESEEGELISLPDTRTRSTQQIKFAPVPTGPNEIRNGCLPLFTDREHWLSDLKACEWFTRGWTLQELVAPKEVYFFSKMWNLIGLRSQLPRNISEITNINELVLKSAFRPGQASVAKTMSWAANRNTKREEDKAYCLLGLLGINMPLLYGERDRAFSRLQKEIIKSSPDCSVLAWQHSTDSGTLAPSLVSFSPCNRINLCEPPRSMSYEYTNRGLKLRLPLIRLRSQRLLAILACRMEDDYHRLLAIHLRERQSERGQGEDIVQCSIEPCTRACHSVPGFKWSESRLHTVSGHKLSSTFWKTVLVPEHNFRIDTGVLLSPSRPSVVLQPDNPLSAIELQPEREWNHDTLTMSGHRSVAAENNPVIGVAHLYHESGVSFIVSFAAFPNINFLSISKASEKPLKEVYQRFAAAMKAPRHIQRYTKSKIFHSSGRFLNIEASAVDAKSYGESLQAVVLGITEGKRFARKP